jgi:hypothetical protein
MDKVTGSGEDTTEIKIWPLENCRFAYTLGNSQPVRCSWISDQPLFYSNYDEIIEDDLLIEDPLMAALEHDIDQLREKTSAYDKIAENFCEQEGHTENLFKLDSDFINTPFSKTIDNLDSLISVLHQSRLASQFLSFAQLNNISLRASRQVADASYDRSSNAILIRPDLDMGTQVLLAARELRRMWQHRHGAGLHPLSVHPDFAVLMNRAQHADMNVSMIRIAWELQLSGYKDAWMHVGNSGLSDLGRAFAREAIVDFRSINNGLAARATFESWFLSERCRKTDRILIQQMLADYQGYVFSDNAETSRLITLDVLKALGKMPFGTNYLESIANHMASDPVFTDVRDRSNANFLWFIKFERSFSEVEKIVETEKPITGEVISFPKRDAATQVLNEKLSKS